MELGWHGVSSVFLLKICVKALFYHVPISGHCVNANISRLHILSTGLL